MGMIQEHVVSRKMIRELENEFEVKTLREGVADGTPEAFDRACKVIEIRNEKESGFLKNITSALGTFAGVVTPFLLWALASGLEKKDLGADPSRNNVLRNVTAFRKM